VNVLTKLSEAAMRVACIFSIGWYQ